MLQIYPSGDPASGGFYIRPTPLISISQNSNRNKMDGTGSTYSITLNGSIVTSRSGIYTPNKDAPSRIVPLISELPTVISDQQKLKDAFKDGCYIEILDIEADNVILSFYADVDNISFDEGIYVDIAKYSINLTANYLTYGPSTGASNITSYYHNTDGSGIVASGANTIEDFNDTWSIETDESNGIALDNGNILPRSYRISRNVSAVGRKVYPHTKEAWHYAKDFILNNILDSGNYYTSLESFINNVTVVPSGFSGYNHIRSENIDKGAGSYSINDTWILGSGKALENFNISINSSTDNPYVSVSIDGNIKGLSSIPASGYNSLSTSGLPYDEALKKYYEITNSGQFGINSQAYKRANNAVAQNLNSQPTSISLGTNAINGEITYNLQFNNRPTNILSGVLSENITVNDTYPGDIFAIIPVLGRTTGPILQYIGGRSEYKRDVGIEFTLDYTDIGYGENRDNLLLKKPSLNEPLKTELINLINELSPRNEPGIRKYFLSPPTENWNPREGRYSINLSWTYELNQ